MRNERLEGSVIEKYKRFYLEIKAFLYKCGGPDFQGGDGTGIPACGGG
jgi:hypothetical protein